METRNIIPLMAQLVDEHREVFTGQHGMLRMATHALAMVYRIMREERYREVSADGLRGLQREMSRFLQYWKA